MPLTPALLYADLARVRSSGQFPFLGFNFDQAAWAISTAVVAWTKLGGVTLSGVCVGTAGVGTINTVASKLLLLPNPPLVVQGLVSAGMAGPLAVSLGTVVSLGIAQSFTSYGQYAGGVAGVGVGSDVSKVATVDPSLLTAQLNLYFRSMLGAGPASAQMAAGLGSGIASMVLATTGTGTVVGSPSVYPAVGSSSSMVV